MDTKEPRDEGAEVVDLDIFRAIKAVKEANAAPAAPADGTYMPGEFARIQEQNKANEERLRKERLNANKGVLRSFRIKH